MVLILEFRTLGSYTSAYVILLIMCSDIWIPPVMLEQ